MTPSSTRSSRERSIGGGRSSTARRGSRAPGSTGNAIRPRPKRSRKREIGVILRSSGRARVRTSSMDVRIKRVYDPAAASDGIRILIDRIWPRGVTREEAHLDEWARELAPSTELRRWFGHDPARFEEFRHRYTRELAA